METVDARPYLEIDDDWQEYPRSDSPILFDARGARRTASLFIETTQDSNRDPIFTMRDHSVKGMICVYDVWMNSVDEGDAAMKLVGSMSHWRKLLRCDWFMHGNAELSFEGLLQWRQDMLTRDMTRAKGIYEDLMRKDDLQAAKAMMALIKDMAKVYKDMSPETKSQSSKRRGSQQPATSTVVDIDSEIRRLKGNE